MRTLAWPLDTAELHHLRDRLRFEFCKWDVFHRGRDDLLPDALVLSADEHAQLVSIAQGCWRALRPMEAKLARQPEALDAIGIPQGLHDAMAQPQPAVGRLTRCDFHLAVGGRWVITEFNEDGPGGLVESHGLHRVLDEDFGDRFDGLRPAGDLRPALLQAFAPYPRIGLVYATGYSLDLQPMALLAGWLREAGHEVVLGSPANLSFEGGSACLLDQPIDAIYRYYPAEWLGDLPNADDWRRAIPAVPMLNTVSALIAQSKCFYAAIEQNGWLEASAEAERLAAHLPESRFLTRDNLDAVAGQRVDWVLKSAFGRMGDTVLLGIGASPEHWQQRLDAALSEGTPHAVQARFDAVPFWFSNGMAYPTVGLFLLDGEFAGYYSRVSPYPVIDINAHHVATLVETA
ncbi:MAG: glutathionylspermidine synthase family protein [Wenzhouxiangella sp.]